MSAANLYEVIRAPRVSEKTARLQEVSNQYVFEVAKTATKADVKAAVEKLFRRQGRGGERGEREGQVQDLRSARVAAAIGARRTSRWPTASRSTS